MITFFGKLWCGLEEDSKTTLRPSLKDNKTDNIGKSEK